MLYINNREYLCFLDYGINFIKGKWKAVIICHLQHGPLRYGVLYRKMGNVSQKVFSQSLRDLENAKLINRLVYPSIPPKVEYLLTDKGKLLLASLKTLENWAKVYIETSGFTCEELNENQYPNAILEDNGI